MFDVVVIGAGPAGLQAALRAGELGARTALVTDALLGGMGAHDGPVPVRALAHAAGGVLIGLALWLVLRPAQAAAAPAAAGTAAARR